MDTTEIGRWNFEADDDGLLVCRGLHESGEHCEAHMERLSPHEVLEIVNAMRAQLLHVDAVLKTLVPNVKCPS